MSDGPRSNSGGAPERSRGEARSGLGRVGFREAVSRHAAGVACAAPVARFPRGATRPRGAGPSTEPERRRPPPGPGRPSRPAAPSPGSRGGGRRGTWPPDDRPAGRGQVPGGAPAAVASAPAPPGGGARGPPNRRRCAGGSGSPRGLVAAPLPAASPPVPTPGVGRGGVPPQAGEATLAHRGVLFLDELGE